MTKLYARRELRAQRLNLLRMANAVVGSAYSESSAAVSISVLDAPPWRNHCRELSFRNEKATAPRSVSTTGNIQARPSTNPDSVSRVEFRSTKVGSAVMSAAITFFTPIMKPSNGLGGLRYNELVISCARSSVAWYARVWPCSSSNRTSSYGLSDSDWLVRLSTR